MRLRLDLDPETTDRLRDDAFRALRTVDAQAIVLLRAGLGLPVPYPPETGEREPAPLATVQTGPEDHLHQCGLKTTVLD